MDYHSENGCGQGIAWPVCVYVEFVPIVYNTFHPIEGLERDVLLALQLFNV